MLDDRGNRGLGSLRKAEVDENVRVGGDTAEVFATLPYAGKFEVGGLDHEIGDSSAHASCSGDGYALWLDVRLPRRDSGY